MAKEGGGVVSECVGAAMEYVGYRGWAWPHGRGRGHSCNRYRGGRGHLGSGRGHLAGGVASRPATRSRAHGAIRRCFIRTNPKNSRIYPKITPPPTPARRSRCAPG